jgi:hypothetical protein
MPGTWKQLSNLPRFEVGMTLLLTDGSVLCQVFNRNQWRRLMPDRTGSYRDGTWALCSDSPHAPRSYASAVLADGSVFVAGGEYDFGSSDAVDLLAAALYDSVSDTWTPIMTPWYWPQIGDAPCCVLPDWTVLLGSIRDNTCAVYDPVGGNWGEAGSKLNDNSNEETWVLLPDGSVLSIDCNGHPGTERYVDGKWLREPDTPVDLVESSSIEVGPAVLLASGQVFAMGATGYTALYTPNSERTKPGTWSPGSTFPKDANGTQLGAKDAPACLLPNGRVLCAMGPVNGVKGDYLGPTTFFEYDPNKPNATALTQVSSPGNADLAPWRGILLLLPSREVMFVNGTTDIWIYEPDGQPQPSWAPQISKLETSLVLGGIYPLEGTQLNGLSQACAYGDDAAMATNYPLVRLYSEQSKQVRYCRTFGHSTMAVGIGPKIPVTTNFKVSTDLATGKYRLSVVANGIASSEVAVTITDAAATSDAG